MKIAALFFILISLFSLKQVFSQQVESLHSIKVGIPSITYSYEHALGKQFSINMEVGTNWGYYYSNNHGQMKYSPILKIEPRLYYSIKRRFEIDRFTNNSASFFCITTTFVSAILHQYERNFLEVIPKWGFRRAMGKHFIFETQLGTGVIFYRNSFLSDTELDIKLGYVF